MEQTNPQDMTPEQVEALKEKLKKMSPEELKEFQKKQCIFCQMISGKVQAKKVFEDDKTIAVLDINPANPGHVLLLPKEHYTVMPQLPDDEISHIFMVAKSLSNAILRALEARGTNIIVANGPAAGQRAQHFMVHIIPRKEKDNVEFSLPQKQIPDKELDIIKDKLAAILSKGAKPKPENKGFDISSLDNQKVVEGDFKEIKEEAKPEEKTELPKQEETKKTKKQPGKPKKTPKEAKKSPKKGVDLDDIADLFGEK